MLSSSTRCQGTGPQLAHLPFGPQRISSLLTSSARVARGPKWHTFLTILLLFFTTAASKEDQSFLSTVSATGWPTGNVTTIFPEKPTNSGHTQWDQQQTDLPFSRLPNQTGVNRRKVGQPPVSPFQHVDSLGERNRRSYATSARVQSTGASLRDLASSPGVGSLGTTERRPLFLRSSREERSQSSNASQFFRSHSNSLLVPSSIPFHVSNSRKVLFDQMTTSSEDYDTVQLAATKSPVDVTSPVTQSLSPLWRSARYLVETTPRVALSTSAALRRLQGEETPGVSTRQPMEPLSMNWSSPRFEPREFFPPSTAVGRSHLDSENPEEASVTISPPIPSLVTLASPSPQRLTADSTLQASQELEANFTMTLRNVSSPDTSTVGGELSFDVAKKERDLLVPGTTGTITPTSLAEMPRHNVSPGMTHLGLLKEASPSLEPQSSLLKGHAVSSTTPPSFGTSQEHEVSLRNSFLVEGMKAKESRSSLLEGYLGPTTSSIFETVLEDEMEASSVGLGFLTHQTTISSPLSPLLSGSAKTGLRVALQPNLSEATAHTIGDGKPLETQYSRRSRESTAAAQEMPTSKSPLPLMETGSIRGLTMVRTEDALPKRRSGAASLSPLRPATPLPKVWQTSKESSEPETMTHFSATEVFSLGTAKNDSAVPSRPHLDKGDVLHPMRAASTGVTNPDLPEGPTMSSAVESFGSPSRPHSTVSPLDLTESDGSSVTPSYRSLSSSVASLPFSRISQPESTMKMFTNIMEGHLVRTAPPNDDTSQQPRSKFTNSLPNQSVKENLTFGKSDPTVSSVRVVSLWFRLLKIKYTNLLMNKSSESYKKLEKEIKLTLKKMLSTYENFLHARVLRFVNGSVIVESQVVFQATSLLPTPSDLIRTIVTQVESRRIDAFFDWRIDVRSLHSNGFSLRNLEPENLAVSFTLLELGSVSVFDDKNLLEEHLDSLKIQMKLLLGSRYAVHLISLVDNRNTQGDIDISGNIFVKSNTHVDVGWMLKALIGLANFSVDLISLSINGSKLNLQVFSLSFLITNAKMLDRSSVEHHNFAKDLSATLARILGKYENLLQVTIRNITGGPLVCYGDVIFQQPAPSNKEVLQTLAFSVDPKDYLDSSSFQVDRFSFTVAGVGLEPALKKSALPIYVAILIVVCLLAVIIVPTLLWLPKALARRGKIRINRAPDAGEEFELDNPGYQVTIEERETEKTSVVVETF